MITSKIFYVFLFCLFTTPSYAMHIMEGYLSPSWSIFWWLASLPFLVFGFYSIKKVIDENPKYLLILAMCGAFAFVLSALKIPSLTGSCSHPTGVGLGAVLFGAAPMVVLGGIILLFQALLLAHGGITTLGANIFSMAIVGTFSAYFVFKILKKLGVKVGIAVFFAVFAGDILTYVATSFQLAFAYPDVTGGVLTSLIKFLSVFALTQLPLAVSEGLLSVIIYNILAKYSSNELKALKVVR